MLPAQQSRIQELIFPSWVNLALLLDSRLLMWSPLRLSQFSCKNTGFDSTWNIRRHFSSHEVWSLVAWYISTWLHCFCSCLDSHIITSHTGPWATAVQPFTSHTGLWTFTLLRGIFHVNLAAKEQLNVPLAPWHFWIERIPVEIFPSSFSIGVFVRINGITADFANDSKALSTSGGPVDPLVTESFGT